MFFYVCAAIAVRRIKYQISNSCPYVIDAARLVKFSLANCVLIVIPVVELTGFDPPPPDWSSAVALIEINLRSPKDAWLPV